ncbi:MAG: methyl-accepting chemotaxis protein [Gammaproteobacteria bacterium]|nr:methyl-accepting chemotaxis protein [Gammaproteobacteria bacterium]
MTRKIAWLLSLIAIAVIGYTLYMSFAWQSAASRGFIQLSHDVFNAQQLNSAIKSAVSQRPIAANSKTLKAAQKSFASRRALEQLPAENVQKINAGAEQILAAAKSLKQAEEAPQTLAMASEKLLTLGPEALAGLIKTVNSLGENPPAGWSETVIRLRQSVSQLSEDLSALADVKGDERVRIEQRISRTQAYMKQLSVALTRGDRQLAVEGILPLEMEQSRSGVIGSLERASSQAASVVAASRQLGALDNAVVSSDEGLAIMQSQLDEISRRVGSSGEGLSMLPILLGVSGLLFLIAIILWSRNTIEVPIAPIGDIDKTPRDQEAIMRLLDEISSLADGDLTVRATVTEDMTGHIADSINYAVEAMHKLVTTIDEAATGLDRAAKQTQASARHLTQASESQTKQVFAATKSISDMAGSIEQVSQNANRSTQVAQQAVNLAGKGDEAVRRTMDGMGTIRNAIQETSKRIKRLGESSQEIGNIVELINDIAEQTNILALNASIQASMAGEAGRGFAVVADEVQRLAERSTNATKQIEVLVRTIQSDTNEAVVSMERSTADVVSGAMLAENAGKALSEIATVSKQISELVKSISNSANAQAMAAADLTRNTGVLQEISSQTADNTSATTKAIGKLAKMAENLRGAIKGFRTAPPADAAVSKALPITDVYSEAEDQQAKPRLVKDNVA